MYYYGKSYADTAKIHHGGEFVAEKRRLENTRGKYDLVPGRVVISIDFLWQHQPRRLVCRLAQ